MTELWFEPGLADKVGFWEGFEIPSGTEVHLISSQDDIDALPVDVECVFVELNDWKVVPTENTLAKYPDTKVIVKTDELGDMITFGGALGRGVDGFLVGEKGIAAHRSYLDGVDVVNSLPEDFEYIFNEGERLLDAVVTSVGVRQADVSVDRVCIDCADSFGEGEGLLIGPSPEMLFLVNSENLVNPYVDTRPWRVNAGVPSSYVLLFDGSFKYLSDLSCDDVLLAIDSEGNTRPITVNRLKIEDRAMTLIKAKYESVSSHIYLQTAETVRLGETAVTDLIPGAKVQVYLGGQIGTHFGKKIGGKVLYK